MNKEKQLKGAIGLYFKWPIITAIIVVAISVVAFIGKFRFAYILGGISLAYIIVTLILFFMSSNRLLSSIEEYAHKYSIAQDEFLNELSIPYALMYESGVVNWMNEEFKNLAKGKIDRNESIFKLFPNLKMTHFPTEDGQVVNYAEFYEGRYFRIELRKIRVEDFENSLIDSIMKVPSFICVYVHDETELNEAITKRDEDTMVTCLVYVDNYEDMISNVEEVQQSMVIALIDRKVGAYFQGVKGLVKKLQRDKYFVIFKKKYLEGMKAARFSLLEDVKTVFVSERVTPTLSIGIGLGGDTYGQSYDFARAAMDMALGRGGDQAVVKEADELLFFGGKTQQMSSGTRVKARTKAEALKELIIPREQIVVMGHKIADVDSFGAAMGIYRIAKTLGKKCHIVIDEVTVSVRPFVKTIIESNIYEKDLFISNEKAIRITNDSTMVFVVDTNRPSYTQCPEILDKAGAVVVIDHHRQTAEVISKSILSYIDPSSSSACEMTAELMQYISENLKITKPEADCLYAGIVLDTNNFVLKTGARTFEAAAYLRRNGADISRVRKVFRDDIRSCQAKAETIQHAALYRNVFVIGRFPESNIESPTVIGSEAANELLNISGIKASFVLTHYKNQIFISARSIDEINVQVIMERLGGGGHMNIAGAQLSGYTIDEAETVLKNVIDEMVEGGEI